MIVNCPLPATLTKIKQPSCPFILDQIVRTAFQRRQAAAPFATATTIQTLSNWDTFLAATDATKIVLSPIFAGGSVPPSEPLTQGGNDNTTFNGIRLYQGEGFVTMSGVFNNLPQETKRDMDLLTQESLASSVGVSNLTIYFFNKNGEGFANSGKPAAGYWGVPGYNFRISSVGGGGFNQQNTNNWSIDLPGNWSDYLVSFLPTFDPLTQLIQP